MPVITPLNIERFIKDNDLREVTSSAVLSPDGTFDQNGLFSTEIFGSEFSISRRNTYSYINLNTNILHPLLFRILKRLDGKLIKLISREENFYFDEKNKTLHAIHEKPKDTKGFNLVSGYSGFEYVIENDVFLRGDTPDREKFINKIKELKKRGRLYVDKVIVIPPVLRPVMIDRNSNSIQSIDDLNMVYTTIIQLAAKLANVPAKSNINKISSGDLLKYDLQLKVNELYEVGKMKSGKKTGLIRSMLLGKRADYSARAVITVDSSLQIGEAGVPLKIAVLTFEPFILHHIFNNLSDEFTEFLYNKVVPKFGTEYDYQSVKKFLTGLSKDYVKDETTIEFMRKIVQDIVNDKVVLLKRDPSLHRLSVQAFKPIIHTGVSISLHPMFVGGFGADFDGDQMGLFVILSREGQEEAKRLMYRAQASSSFTASTYSIINEMVLGCYLLTKQPNIKEKQDRKNIGEIDIRDLRKDPLFAGITNPSLHIYDKCVLKMYDGTKRAMTLGRAVFHSIFDADFIEDIFEGELKDTVDKKLAASIGYYIQQYHDPQTAYDTLDRFKHVTFEYTTIYSVGLPLSELTVGSTFSDLKDKFNKAKTFEEKQKISNEIENKIKTGIDDVAPSIATIVKSGARGNVGQVRQMLVTKGVVQDSQGNLMTINSNFSDGLNSEGYFSGGYSARKGIMDRTRQVSTTGYLFRKLIYALASVQIDFDLQDCKTKKTIETKVTETNYKRLYGRYIVENNRLKLIEISNAKDYIGKRVELRSPIFCKSLKICKTCYGELYKKLHTPYIGILAGQTLGERGSQEMMKTFHTGGATTVVIPDLLESAADNNPIKKKSDFEKYIKQDVVNLITKQNNIILEISSNDYLNFGNQSFSVDNPEKSKIIMKTNDKSDSSDKISTFIILPNLVSKIILTDKKGEVTNELELILDQKIYINLSNVIQHEEFISKETGAKIIRLVFGKAGTKLLTVETSTSDLSNTVDIVLKIIEKKNLIKYVQTVFNKIANIYANFNVDLVHSEILISQLFRNKNNPQFPARIIEPYDSKIYGIKKIPELESWFSALLFENAQRAIETGLVTDKVIENPLEKLLSKEFNL